MTFSGMKVIPNFIIMSVTDTKKCMENTYLGIINSTFLMHDGKQAKMDL